MKIPIHTTWQQNMTTFLRMTQENGFQLIEPKEEVKRQTFSILLQTSPEINKKILKINEEKIPQNIKSKLFMQPEIGYHVTLQWMEVPEKDIQEHATEELTKYLQTISTVTATITGPYTSAKNLFFTVTTSDNIQEIREGLDTILKKYDLVTKLPLAFNLLWISTCRFIEQPTTDERNMLFETLEQEEIINVPFDKANIAINDPFFSDKPTKLATVNLN